MSRIPAGALIAEAFSANWFARSSSRDVGELVNGTWCLNVNIAGVSFRAFGDVTISRLIEDAAGASQLSVLVGAGASMEAGLPSWETLVNRLLSRAARERGLIEPTDLAMLDRWVTEAARDGYLGAAAIVDALAGGERDAWLAQELFAPALGPEAFAPGPISRQIARLHDAFGRALRVMTLNYDDLLEQAFRETGSVDPVAIATDDHRVPSDALRVYHLHGYLGRDGRARGDLVLSEADYQRMQQGGAWQEEMVRAALRDSTLVFVGTSLMDPNLVRYLHSVRAGTGASCFAVFVRQGTYTQDVPSGIPPAREEALRARWEAVGVVPVFVDHYVDVAQLMYEIARARQMGDRYRPLPERAAEWVQTVQRELLGMGSDERFIRAQHSIGAGLRSALATARAAAERLEGRTWNEKLALTMWLVDEAGEHLTSWVTTDRLHIDRETVEPVRIDEHGRWLAVRAYCRGTPLAESRDIYASRWHFIRGTPLVADTATHGRIPIGCLTAASMKRGDETMLNGMEDVVEAGFNNALTEAVLALLEQPFTR